MNRRKVTAALSLGLFALACGGHTTENPTGPSPPDGAQASQPPIGAPQPSDPAVLFREDFDGSPLNDTGWFIPEGEGTFLGRTQLRPARERLEVMWPDALSLLAWSIGILVPATFKSSKRLA